jgi:hypothetical protein
MADEQQKAATATAPKEPAQVISMHGRPVSAHDILTFSESEDAVEYKRVPAFKNGEVFVLRNLRAGDIIEWSEASEGPAKREAGLKLMIRAIVDGEPGKDAGATGQPVMNESHIQGLRRIPHKYTERVIKDIIKMNEMSVRGGSEAKND